MKTAETHNESKSYIPAKELSDMNAGPPPYDVSPNAEEQIRTALRALEALLQERDDARARSDQAEIARIEERIVAAMRSVGNAYPEGETRRNWCYQADEFLNANGEEREHILLPIAKGLGILIAAPLALAFGIAGGAIFAVGSILYGAGKVVLGVGSLLTFGAFR